MADAVYDFAWRRTLNLSGTDIRASQTEPMLVSGFQYELKTDEDGEEVWFVITDVMDFRAVPGFKKGNTPTGTDDPDLQIPYHKGGTTDFTLDSGPCN